MVLPSLELWPRVADGATGATLNARNTCKRAGPEVNILPSAWKVHLHEDTCSLARTFHANCTPVASTLVLILFAVQYYSHNNTNTKNAPLTSVGFAGKRCEYVPIFTSDLGPVCKPSDVIGPGITEWGRMCGGDHNALRKPFSLASASCHKQSAQIS